MTMKRKAILIFSAIILLIVLWICCLDYENTSLSVSRYEIVNKKIPQAFHGFKIIQISDFHNTRSKKLTNALWREIKKQNPDIIVFTGDFIDSYKTDIDGSVDFVKEIKDIAPAYFVTGNHEARIDGYAKLKDELTKNGVIILDDKAAVIQKGDAQFCLLGVDDPSMARGSFLSDEEIVDSALNNMEYDKNDYCVLLSHRPEIFPCYVRNEIDLVLTGHAHGGQIRIPFLGGLYAPNQGVFPKYTSGSFAEDETTMIVSRGIGNSLFPFRIHNRPELVVVTLKAE